MRLIYPACTVAQRFVLRLLADYAVTGSENVPPQGPVLVVANHQSNFDPSLLAASFPRPVWFLAKDTIFRNSVARWFLTSYHAFPLNRDDTDIRAYRWALSRLQAGVSMVVFPEGTRSKGGLNKAKSGVARLALKTGVPLVPVGIVGTERMGTVFRVFNPTGRIRVNIGPAFALPPFDGRPAEDDLEAMTETIMRRIAALLPERYQGFYGPGTRAVSASSKVV